MRLKVLTLCLLWTTAFVWMTGLTRVEAQVESPTIALTNAHVLDGVSNPPIREATVLIRDGKIASVGARQPAPAGASVIDLQGKWLIPGLIDAHVHFANVAAGRIALRQGVTTVRSGGVARFLDTGIRELNHAGLADLPDVIAAGYQVRRGGNGLPPDEFLLDFPDLLDVMRDFRGPDKVRRLVRALAGRGVNVIKVVVSAQVRQDPRRRVFDDEELAAIVDEAKRASLPVMAHAHDVDGAAAAVRAGVQTIEHGTYMNDQTLALMKQRGTCLTPTLTGISRELDPSGDPVATARARAIVPIRRAMAARAIKAGVRIIAGTDIGYDDKYTLQDELAGLVQLGMTWDAALKSATSEAAACLGIDGRTGSLKPGLEADLIAVDRSPIEDIDALRDPLLIVNNGKIAVNRIYP